MIHQMQRETIKASRDKSQITYSRNNQIQKRMQYSFQSPDLCAKMARHEGRLILKHRALPVKCGQHCVLLVTVTVLKTVANLGRWPKPHCPEFSLRPHDLCMIYWNTNYITELNLQVPSPSWRSPGSKPQITWLVLLAWTVPSWVTSLAQII